jgi:EPS-associated MarR family transcriptional regulator
VERLAELDELERRSSRGHLDFELLYLIETEPGLTQRQLAERLGISLGRVNYCIKALTDKGAVKLSNFRHSNGKLRYIHVLTPSGLAHRASMTAQFLGRKLEQYERLKTQIAALEDDLARRKG